MAEEMVEEEEEEEGGADEVNGDFIGGIRGDDDLVTLENKTTRPDDVVRTTLGALSDPSIHPAVTASGKSPAVRSGGASRAGGSSR